MKGKLIIFSAPSGSGKTTIVKRLLQREHLNLEFSISACTRPRRSNEVDGEDYYFLSKETFKAKVENDEFVEWEEVYKDHYYGTLKSEVERIRNKGKNVIFDIDVEGGLNLKQLYGKEALAIFVMPPSVEALEKRLLNRSSDESGYIKIRVEKAKAELKYADRFDVILYNDELNRAVEKADEIVRNFLHI
ncbi:MAG: guanylate kinase [Bacteroidota bacterium]